MKFLTKYACLIFKTIKHPLGLPCLRGAELRDASDRTTGGTYSAGFSLYIRSCKLRMQIVNVQNIMTTVWIYECVLRRDINVGDLDARVDWQEGIDAQGGDDTDFARPYSTPFTSRRFCTKWRVAKVTRAIVSPGETHVHYVHANVKHKLSSKGILISMTETVLEQLELEDFLPVL